MPVQVQCTMLDAWGWCTGMTQRDGMGREEGGGFRMRNTCFKIIKFKNKKKRKEKKIRYCDLKALFTYLQNKPIH